MFKEIVSAIAGMMVCINVSAQDCNAKFEVNAGPDIDVCESGSVGLNGIIGGDATEAVWRGGKGTFTPDRKALNAEYTPAPEEIGSGVVLVLVASDPKMKCTPARSEIKITVNAQPKSNAGENIHACEGMAVQMKGSITGKAKELVWQSNGSGKFDDAGKADAKYFPSEKDIQNGGCSINLIAVPYGVCIPDTSTMILMIDKGPEFITDAVKAMKVNR